LRRATAIAAGARRWGKAAVTTLVVAGVALAVWSIAVEPGRLVVRRHTVVLPGWPAALAGWTIVALADIHAGAPHVDADYLRRVVAAANEQRPDLVVLLGDYVISGVVGGRFIRPEDTARELAALRARHGVVSVLGNHDWWLDGKRVRRALEDAHLRPLENAALPIRDRGTTVWMAGLADLWTREPDLAAALRSVPESDPVIVLTHSPDVFPTVPPRVSLTIAGHTHGGQVALPLLGRLVVPSRYGQRYAVGVVEEEGRVLFVSPGVGTSIVPVRFRVPPEVSVLTLVPARESDTHAATIERPR
jgi:uncharacterized protein